MTWVGWLVGVVWAAPLRFEVVPDPPEPAAERAPRLPRPWVPVTAAEIVVDGTFEQAWDAVRPAPPLLPRTAGPRPPDLAARVAWTGSSWVVAAPPATGQAVHTWVFDPGGVRARWWRVTVRAGGVTAEVCTLADVRLPHPWWVPSRSVPCRPAALEVASGEDGVEIAIPATEVTTAARLHWTVVDGEGGGTWGPSGRTDPFPEHGRGLLWPQGAVRGRVKVHPDPARDAWNVEVDGVDLPARSWAWAHWHHGQVVDAGEVELGAEGARFSMPWRRLPEGYLTLTAPFGAPPVRLVARLGAPEATAWVASAVADRDVAIRWVTPREVTSTVQVWNARGRVRREAEVVLPEGAGTLWLRRPWAGRVIRITLDPLMRQGAVVVRSR